MMTAARQFSDRARGYRRPRLLQLAVLAVLFVLFALLAFTSYTVDANLRLKGAELATQAAGVYPAELMADSRTAVHVSTQMRLPQAAYAGGPALVSLDLRLPGDIDERTVQLWLDESPTLTFAVSPGWRRYSVVLPAQRQAAGWLGLNLTAATSSFPPDDRLISVSLAGMTSRPLAENTARASLALRTLLLLALLALVLYLAGTAALLAVPLAGAGLLLAQPLLGAGLERWQMVAGGLAGLVALLALRARRRRNRSWLVHGPLIALSLLLLVWDMRPGSEPLITHIVLLTAAALGLLLYAGFGLTWLLRSPAHAPFLGLLTPFIGLAAISAAGHALAYVPVGTRQSAWPLLALFTGINLLAWRQGARLQFRRDQLPALPGALLALLLALAPLCLVGYVTVVGNSTDAISYLSRAEYFQHHAIMDKPQRRLDRPMTYAIASQMFIGMREGDVYFLSMLASLLDVRAHTLFPIVMAIWYALIPIGAYLLARYALRLPLSAASIAALSVAVQPLLFFPVIATFFSQVAALALWPVLLVSIPRVLRKGSRRGICCVGLLIAALASVYQSYLLYLAPLVLIWGLADWRRSVRARLRRLTPGAPRRTRGAVLLATAACRLRRGLGILLAALVLMPVAWILVARTARFIRNQITDGRIPRHVIGDTLLFPPLGEIVGVVNHLAWHGAQPLPFAAHPSWLSTSLLLLSAVPLIYVLIRGGRAQRGSALAMLAVFSIGLWQQRFVLNQGQGFAYGYFKLISLACIPLMVTLVYGLRLLAGDLQRQREQPVFLVATARLGTRLLFAVLFISALFFTVQTIAIAGTQIVYADRAMLEIQEAQKLVPPGDPLLVADYKDPTAWYWDLQMLGPRSVYFVEPAPLWKSAVQAQSPRMIRYALIGSPSLAQPGAAKAPWLTPQTRQIIWQNERYLLARRTDNVVAELPAPLDDLLPPLTRTLEIEVNNGWLRVWEAGRSEPLLQQRLAGSPRLLELVFKGERQARVSIAQGGQQRALTLLDETHQLEFQIGDLLRLRVQQLAGPAAELFAVRVRGVPQAGDS